MKYLRKFKSFNEDGSSVGVSTSGMGAITNATVGSLPGVAGESGSGDVSQYLRSDKQKKGDPSQVSDARFLDDVDDEIEDIDDLKGDN